MSGLIDASNSFSSFPMPDLLNPAAKNLHQNDEPLPETEPPTKQSSTLPSEWTSLTFKEFEGWINANRAKRYTVTGINEDDLRKLFFMHQAKRKNIYGDANTAPCTPAGGEFDDIVPVHPLYYCKNPEIRKTYVRLMTQSIFELVRSSSSIHPVANLHSDRLHRTI